jgi:hypothetical protein
LNQWETYDWEFPHGKHPCIVISPQARAANPAIDTVNVLGASSARASTPPSLHQVLLDKEDGMDWKRSCDVTLFT